MSISAYGQHHISSTAAVISVPRGKIDVTFPSEHMRVSPDELLAWVKKASDAVSNFYGYFPVPHLTLRIRSTAGSGVHNGVTYQQGGGLIVITVGRDSQVEDLADDWVLPHEMTHLAFPNMADEHRWIEEGLATYIETIARAQVHQLPVSEVWREFIRDMPQGQPEPGDEGLDHTPTWGRTYWGGAMFCLVADVKIRERTQNRKGLRDALRAIVEQGGSIAEDWEIEKALVIGDKATGTQTLIELYHEMRDKPVPVDLDRLWNKLGVTVKHSQVVFDDKAPGANIRKAITATNP